MKGIHIIDTADGSHSLFHEALNETYHSRHGAIQESSHVFLKNGYDHHQRTPISVLEYGFGTGLNALLTAVQADRMDRHTSYTTLEAFPLTRNITEAINYAEKVNHPQSHEWFKSLHELPWERAESVHDRFMLKKIHIPFEDFETDELFDLVYYDAFAPSRQPELWGKNMLAKVCKLINSGGMFVTYSAMGQLKRDLKDLGLAVVTLEGPPGKKEMIRAVKP